MFDRLAGAFDHFPLFQVVRLQSSTLWNKTNIIGKGGWFMDSEMRLMV